MASINDIRNAMNERYASGAAYPVTTLWDKVRGEELDRVVKAAAGHTQGWDILDVGCGIGGCASFISECKSYTGIDISEVAIGQASQAYSGRLNFHFLAMDAARLSFGNGSFDMVIAREVIEHKPGAAKALAEIHRVLRPGGFLILTSPNRDSLHLRINRILGHADFKCSFDHVREFTFTEMERMLSRAGFTIIKDYGVFLQPYWGIAGLDEHVRYLTDNDPQVVELLRELGQRVGGEYAFCYVLLAVKPQGDR